MTGPVIIGSGIAGLTAALELGGCTVVTRSTLGAGATRWAQGGIAAALGTDDSAAAHAADTMDVSSGLTIDAVVRQVTSEAPERIRWLAALGAGFDQDPGGAFALGHEAGHRHRRILHAGGDATGAAVMRALVAAVRARSDIHVRQGRRAIDLIRRGDHVVGVRLATGDGHLETLMASAVVLATGGIGQAYAHTTNPRGSTGDGLAMALRAGAQIRDPEFVQFHPTALRADADPLPLLTEALRGEGARLVDVRGRPYMADVHPDADLAPRDVVARANWEAQQRGPIHLDARTIGEAFPRRFPTVFAACRAVGIDPRSQPIPVTPAQHYHVGGIRTDDRGRTSLDGLYACGEVASIGLHGANRLASNSLLEGLVLGGRVAEAIREEPVTIHCDERLEVPVGQPDPHVPDDAGAVERLRATMWRHGGLVRDREGLDTALETVERLRSSLECSIGGRNLVAVANTVLRAARAREESRGTHHRRDHPSTDPGAGVHTIVQDREVARTGLVPGGRVRGVVA